MEEGMDLVTDVSNLLEHLQKHHLYEHEHRME